jgi:hypothetical protein
LICLDICNRIMSTERRFQVASEATFDWRSIARACQVPDEVAHALYVRALDRVRDPRRAEALYRDWLRAPAPDARRIPTPGRTTRTMIDADPARAPATPRPGRRSLTSALAAEPRAAPPRFEDFLALGWQHVVHAATAVRGARAPVADVGTGPLWRAAERRAVTLYRRAVDSGAIAHDAPAVDAALARCGSGQPLPDRARIAMEARLGIALDRVRVHTDHVAAEAALAVNAEAFTVGEDIFFAAGAYAPESLDGQRLLAHELTHVVQAWQGRTRHERAVSMPGDPLEREAEAAADRVTHPAPAPVAPTTPPPPAPAPSSQPVMRKARGAPAAGGHVPMIKGGARPSAPRSAPVAAPSTDFVTRARTATSHQAAAVKSLVAHAATNPPGKAAHQHAKAANTTSHQAALAAHAEAHAHHTAATAHATTAHPAPAAPAAATPPVASARGTIQLKPITDWSKFMPEALPDQDDRERKQLEGLVKGKVNGERAQAAEAFGKLRNAHLAQAAEVRASAPKAQAQIAGAQQAALAHAASTERAQAAAVQAHVASVVGQVTGRAGAEKAKVTSAHAQAIARINASYAAADKLLTDHKATADAAVDLAEVFAVIALDLDFAKLRADFVALGGKKAGDALQTGEDEAGKMGSEWHGDKLDAAQKAARDTADGFATQMPDQAMSTYGQIEQNRQPAEDSLHDLATSTRTSLEQVYTTVKQTLDSVKASSIAAADSARAAALAQIDQASATTTAGLRAQGAAQGAAIHQHGSAARGQLTHAGAAAQAQAAQMAAQTASGLEGGAAGIVRAAQQIEAPSPDDVARTIAKGSADLETGSAGIAQGLGATASASAEGLTAQATAAAQGMTSLARSAQAQATQTGGAAMQQITTIGEAAVHAFAPLADGAKASMDKVATDAQTTFTAYTTNLTTAYAGAATDRATSFAGNLSQCEGQLDGVVPKHNGGRGGAGSGKKADGGGGDSSGAAQGEVAAIQDAAKKAADAVKPWWQKALAVVAAVVVSIAVVIVVTALVATTGPVGLILVGAAAGALSSVAGTMASNLVLGNGLMDGVTWKSVAIGALGGALCAGATVGLGAAAKAVAGSTRLAASAGTVARGVSVTAKALDTSEGAMGGLQAGAIRYGANLITNFGGSELATYAVEGKLDLSLQNLLLTVALNKLPGKFEHFQENVQAKIKSKIPFGFQVKKTTFGNPAKVSGGDGGGAPAATTAHDPTPTHDGAAPTKTQPDTKPARTTNVPARPEPTTTPKPGEPAPAPRTTAPAPAPTTHPTPAAPTPHVDPSAPHPKPAPGAHEPTTAPPATHEPAPITASADAGAPPPEPPSAHDTQLSDLGYPAGTRDKGTQLADHVARGDRPTKDTVRDTSANQRGVDELQQLARDPSITPEDRLKLQQDLANKLHGDPEPTGDLARDLRAARARQRASAKPDAAHQDAGGTAANIGGFRGDARPPTHPDLTADTLHAQLADRASMILPDGVRAHGDGFVLPDGTPITVEVGPSRDGSVASYEHTGDSYAVTVSSRAADADVARSVAHELAEIAMRARGVGAGPDALAADRPLAPDAQLSAHDHGRLAEMRVLGDEIATNPGDVRARQELHTLMDELGLRTGAPDAAARFELIKTELDPRTRAAVERFRDLPPDLVSGFAELSTVLDGLFHARLTPGEADHVPALQRELAQLTERLGLTGPDAETRLQALGAHDPALRRWLDQVAPGAVPSGKPARPAPTAAPGGDPMLPPYARPQEVRSRPPEPFTHDGKSYDVMGMTPDGQLLLRDPRAVQKDFRVESLTGRKVTYNGEPWQIERVRSDGTFELVGEGDRKLTLSGDDAGAIKFRGFQDMRTLGDIQHGIARTRSSIPRDQVPVALEPGQHFEARLRGRELEGTYDITTGDGGKLVAHGFDRDGNPRQIDIAPDDIAPRYEAVMSPDFKAPFDVDAFKLHEDQARGQADGGLADPLLGRLPDGTRPSLTNGSDHLAELEQFIRDRAAPDATITADADGRRLTVFNISMSNQGEAGRVLDAMLEFRRQNPDAEITIVASKLGPSKFQASPEFHDYLQTLADNRIYVDTFTGASGPTRQVIHGKGITVDDDVLLGTGAVMDTHPVDKADFAIELPPDAAAAFARYQQEAILGDATPARRQELAQELARHGVVINDPVAGLPYISRAQDALIRGATGELTVSMSEIKDPALAQLIIDRAAAGADVVVQVRELDPVSARLFTDAAKQYPNLRFEDTSWWEPRPHFNAIVADADAYVGTSYLWPTQRNMIHQGRSFESGVLLHGDAAGSVHAQINELRTRALADHTPATAPAPHAPAGDHAAIMDDAGKLRTDDGSLDPAIRDKITNDLRQVEIDPTNQWVASRQVAEVAAPSLGRRADELEVKMVVGGGPEGHGPTVFQIKDVDGNFLGVLKLSPLDGDFFPQLSAFDRMTGPDAPAIGGSQAVDVARRGDDGMTLMTAAQGAPLRDLMVDARHGEPAAVQTLRDAYAKLGESLAHLHDHAPGPETTARVTRTQDRVRGTFDRLAPHLDELVKSGLDPDARTLLDGVLARFADDPGAPALGHGDAHPGNFFHDPDQGITMIDFGGMHDTMDADGRGTGFAEHDVERMVYMTEQFALRDDVPSAVAEQAIAAMMESYQNARTGELSQATRDVFKADSLLSKLDKSLTRFRRDLDTADGRAALERDIAALNAVLRGAGGGTP